MFKSQSLSFLPAWILSLIGLQPAAFCLLRNQLVRALCDAVGHGSTNTKIVALVKRGDITDSEFQTIRDSYRLSCKGVHGKRIKQPRRTFRDVVNAIRIIRRVVA